MKKFARWIVGAALPALFLVAACRDNALVESGHQAEETVPHDGEHFGDADARGRRHGAHQDRTGRDTCPRPARNGRGRARIQRPSPCPSHGPDAGPGRARPRRPWRPGPRRPGPGGDLLSGLSDPPGRISPGSGAGQETSRRPGRSGPRPEHYSIAPVNAFFS